MRIIQVTPGYDPETGGVETHVRELSRRLAHRGHEVTVFTVDSSRDLPRLDTDKGVNIRRFRGLSPGGAFHFAPGLLPAIARADADVIHAHNYHSLVAPLTAAAARRRFVVTTHYHGASASKLRDFLLRAYHPLGKTVLRRADHVVAVSDWERLMLADHFGVDATVIPNGLDVDRFAGATPEPHDGPYLLSVGRLEEYKGVQHVIRSLPELSGMSLIVAGNGPYRRRLERIAANVGVDDRVRFLGYVHDERLPGLYAGAEAYVSMSEFEAYGMTVAEALAAETPCVVNREGLSNWCGEENVVCVSVDGVADGVKRAAWTAGVDTQLRSWDAVTDQIERLYRPGCPPSRDDTWP